MNLFISKLDKSLQRTKEILWPIKRGLWLNLIVLLILSGGIGGPFQGIPGGFGDKLSMGKEDNVPLNPTENLESSSSLTGFDDLSSQGKIDFIQDKFNTVIPYLFSIIGLSIGLIVFLILIFFTWVCSRFQIMLIQALAEKKFGLRDNWRQARTLGNSMFRLNFYLYLFPEAVVFAVLLFNLAVDGISSLKLLPGGLLAVLLSCIFILAILFIFIFMVTALILPIIVYAKNESAWTAFKRILTYIRRNILASVKTGLFYWIFSIAGSLAVSIVVVLLVLIGAIPFVILFLAGIKLLAGTTLIVKLTAGLLFSLAAGSVLLLLIFIPTVPLQTFLTYLRMELIAEKMKTTVNPIS